MQGMMRVSLAYAEEECGHVPNSHLMHVAEATFDGHPVRESLYFMTDQMCGISLLSIDETSIPGQTIARFSLGNRRNGDRLERGLAWRFDLVNPTLPAAELPTIGFVF